jgi:hypothetical protein
VQISTGILGQKRSKVGTDFLLLTKRTKDQLSALGPKKRRYATLIRRAIYGGNGGLDKA